MCQDLKDQLVGLYSQASRFRRMLESEARKVNYLFPDEPPISTNYFDQHVKRLEHFRLSPAPHSPAPKQGRRPRFWMIWFLAGVAAAASMALTIYARLEHLKKIKLLSARPHCHHSGHSAVEQDLSLLLLHSRHGPRDKNPSS